MGVNGSQSYRILIVGDHRILRQGLRVLLDGRADFHVLADVEGRAAIGKAIELQPSVVLLDLKLPQIDDGLRLLVQFRQEVADARVIVLTPSGAETSLVLRTLRAGAVGYVPEDSADIHVVEEAVRKVGQGHLFLSDSALASLIATITSSDALDVGGSQKALDGLSPREYDVLDLVAVGYTNRQISKRLSISESTVRSHLHNILDKLHLDNRVQLAAYALRTRPPSPIVDAHRATRRQWIERTGA